MTETPEKAKRHREIRSLVRHEEVSSQDDLLRLLARRGHDVTQATLSRDLRELRIARVPLEEGYRYVEGVAEGAVAYAAPAPHATRMRSVAALEVTGVESNETCVVVRTLTGRAQGVAVWLDQLGLDDLLATVAGDDTILAIPRTTKRTARLARELSRALGTGPPATSTTRGRTSGRPRARPGVGGSSPAGARGRAEDRHPQGEDR